MYGSVTLEARITESGREVRLNGNKITRNADILGNIFSVFFSPHELRLIQDGPDERRRFLNVSISQLSKPYFVALSRYNKILELYARRPFNKHSGGKAEACKAYGKYENESEQTYGR